MVLPSLRSSHVWIAEFTMLVPGSRKCGVSKGALSAHNSFGISGKKVSGVISTEP